MEKMNVLCVEMEAAALYMNAARAGKMLSAYSQFLTMYLLGGFIGRGQTKHLP